MTLATGLHWVWSCAYSISLDGADTCLFNIGVDKCHTKENDKTHAEKTK